MEAQAIGLPAFDHQAVHQVVVVERMAGGGDRGGKVEVEKREGVFVEVGLEQVLARLGFGQQDGVVLGAGDGRGVLARFHRGQGFLEQREVDQPFGVGGVQFRAGVQRNAPGRITEGIVQVPFLVQLLQEPSDAFRVGFDDGPCQFGGVLRQREVHFLESSGRDLFRDGMIADQVGLELRQRLVARFQVIPSFQVRRDAGRGA